MIKRDGKMAELVSVLEVEIKQIIKRGYFGQIRKDVIFKQCQQVIQDRLKEVSSKQLKQDIERSLLFFMQKCYMALDSLTNNQMLFLAAVMVLNGAKIPNMTSYKARQVIEQHKPKYAPNLSFETTAKGIPTDTFSKDYMRKVNSVMDELIDIHAVDPSSVEKRNSLRNLAEMQVRYEEHQKQIADFKGGGVKLVVCSTHADCSDRCFKYQGKIYSLDGTSGVTADGKKYEPLENATNNKDDEHITKAGRVYQNGLLGFNCRHQLYEYKQGMVIPHVNKETQVRESKINTMQREMEREILKAKTEAVSLKDINQKASQAARNRANSLTRQYKTFSKANGRAYYPARIRLY